MRSGGGSVACAVCGIRPLGSGAGTTRTNADGGTAGKAEGVRCGTHEDLRGDGSARFFLVIDDWTRTMRPDGVVAVMAGQMRMDRLTVMMPGLVGVEMHVQERRADRACLHQHDEGGRGQPAKHPAIVVKDGRSGT